MLIGRRAGLLPGLGVLLSRLNPGLTGGGRGSYSCEGMFCVAVGVMVEKDKGRVLKSLEALAMIGLISEALALFDRTMLLPLVEDGVGGTLFSESWKA